MTARAAARVSTLLIVGLGILVFASAVADAPRFKSWDYGPHQLVTRSLVRGIAAGHVPQWLLSASTGDAPLDTYPWLTYAAAALLAIGLGGESEAPRALLLLATLCHVAISLLIARLAARFAPLWIATGLGALALLDAGRFESGAAMTVLEVGLLHAALGQCFGLAGLLGVLDLLQRGITRRRAAIAAAGFGLACATHPSGLLFSAAAVAALLASAGFERAPPRRCLYATLAVTGGVLAAAVVWAPFAERTLLYAAHFGYPPFPLGQALARILSGEQPPTSFPWVFGLGWLGVAAVAARRPRAGSFLAALMVLLALGFSDVLQWLGFDIAPRLFARLQAFRLLTLLRPLLFVAAGIALATAWRAASRSQRLGRFARPALAGGLLLAVGSALLPASLAALRRLPRAGLPDPAGFAALVAWAREETGRLPAGKLARLMFRGHENGVYHVPAEGGPPAFHVGDAVGMLLRERIADASPESLRRFDVRFVARFDRELEIGDPASERRFGRYVVRELASWDGELARVESGPGRARVSRLGDERIDVSLEATDQPALVALGMGYYPRWRATTAGGTALPTFALPATPGSSVRVLAAWLPPGETTLRADRPLPSDGAGRARGVCGVAILGGLLIRRPRRRADLRRLARLSSGRRLRRGARGLILFGLAAALALTVGLRVRAPQALRLFDGWRTRARVEARPDDGAWSECRPERFRGRFECPGLGSVADAIGWAINDHPSSTPFVTPGILAMADQGRPAEFRVRWERAPMGAWVAAAWGVGSAWLGAPNEPRRIGLEATRGSSDSMDDVLLLRVKRNSKLGATIVRPEAVDVDRTEDVPWAPALPPAEVLRAAARPLSPRP